MIVNHRSIISYYLLEVTFLLSTATPGVEVTASTSRLVRLLRCVVRDCEADSGALVNIYIYQEDIDWIAPRNTKNMGLHSRKRVYRYGNLWISHLEMIHQWWMFQIYISFLEDSHRQPRKNTKTNDRWSNGPRKLIKACFICVCWRFVLLVAVISAD